MYYMHIAKCGMGKYETKINNDITLHFRMLASVQGPRGLSGEEMEPGRTVSGVVDSTVQWTAEWKWLYWGKRQKD